MLAITLWMPSPLLQFTKCRAAFFFEHEVIVCLHAILREPTQHIFVLFTHCKWVVGIVSLFRPKATVTVTFHWLSNIINQWNAGTGVCFGLRHRIRLCLKLWEFDVTTAVEMMNHFEVLDLIFVRVELVTMSGLNKLGHSENYLILLPCNLKVCRMVHFDMFMSPPVWGEPL